MPDQQRHGCRAPGGGGGHGHGHALRAHGSPSHGSPEPLGSERSRARAVRAVLSGALSDRPRVHAGHYAVLRRPRGGGDPGGMRTVLHTESSPGLGGQEVRTLNEARWTAEQGWRVLLAGQPDGRFVERARAAGLEVVSIVHTHSSVDGWVAGLAARAAAVPVVRTRHVSIRIRRRWNPVYRWLADRVITSGEAIRDLVVEAGVDPGRVVAIPAGVDLAEFTGARD